MKQLRFLVPLIIFILGSLSLPGAADTASILSGTSGPVLQINQIGDGVNAILGARIDATILNMLLLGIGGYGKILQSSVTIKGTPENFSFFYGGLGIGVRLFPKSFIHLTNYNTFGFGRINLSERNEKDFVFSIEPELNLEFDFFSFFRVGAGLAYRWRIAKNLDIPVSALSGFGGQTYIQFGWL